jgi:arsenite/tail-anchored protein-transporting ATPase
VEGFKNLYGMVKTLFLKIQEIDPNFDTDEIFGDFVSSNSSLKNLVKDFAGSMPGMDELTSFMEIMKLVKQMKFSCVVFDTAPTGHTLRLLSLPSLFDGGIGKMLSGGMMGQVASMFGGIDTDQVQQQTSGIKDLVEEVKKIFRDPVCELFD